MFASSTRRVSTARPTSTAPTSPTRRGARTGTCCSSRLRPIVTMHPCYVYWLSECERHLALDLRIVDWLEATGRPYDILTDEEVHTASAGCLAEYRAVLTGSHPEYVS